MARLVHKRSWHEAKFLLVEHVIDQGDRTHQGQAHGPPTAEREHTVDEADLTSWIWKGSNVRRGMPTFEGWASHNAILTGPRSLRERAMIAIEDGCL